MSTSERTRPHGRPRCGAKTRQGEGTCRQSAGARTGNLGVGRCWLHGGASPNAKRAAGRELVHREITQAVEILGANPVDDPLRALQQLGGQVLAWKNALAARVDMNALLTANTEQVRAEVVLLERAMDRCATVLSAIARLDIDERLARVDEATALIVVRAVEAALAAVGMTGTAAETARQVISRHLRHTTEGEKP